MGMGSLLFYSARFLNKSVFLKFDLKHVPELAV